MYTHQQKYSDSFIFQAYGLNNLQNLIKFQFLLYYKNIVQEKYTYIKNWMLFSNVLIEQREERNLQKVNIIRNIKIIYSIEYRLYYYVIFSCIFLTIPFNI